MSGLSDGFWAAAADHRLVRPVCDACSRSFFTPSLACPHCLSESWHWEDSSGTGTVYSLTTVHQGPDESWAVPYVLAMVDVDEGWTMLSRLVGAPGDTPDLELIGSRVSVTFRPEDREPHRTLPVFELTS